MAAYPVQDISYWILRNLGYLTRKSKRNASFMTFQILTATHSLFSHGYKDSELTCVQGQTTLHKITQNNETAPTNNNIFLIL